MKEKYPELTEKCKGVDDYMEEIWKDVKGFEGLYKISSLGRVKSLKRKGNWKEKILKAQLTYDGYLVVGLYENRSFHRKAIHRLLAENFIDNPNKLPTVDHINRNKKDNRIENLRWASYSLQNYNKKTTYAPSNLKAYTKKGKDNPNSKPVCQYDLQGKLIHEYGAIREAERKTGIKAQYILRCCKGKISNINGFAWKYKQAITDVKII